MRSPITVIAGSSEAAGDESAACAAATVEVAAKSAELTAQARAADEAGQWARIGMTADIPGLFEEPGLCFAWLSVVNANHSYSH
jgi:hypothetical protein